ncbi:MAG: 4Fe-4S binding protein [Clostridia bacterium]|jgi:MinD superfamily P-loop ATPase|nr:4Fe-4S binding protein [Clostridia bacterium]MDH7572842.1 4Fe-4S binding protein [Clostridia bacterium]
MKELVVLSGKGGTGKTGLVASFAALAGGAVLADADVDASNLHLILRPTLKETEEFWSGVTAVIDADRCEGCGLCRQVCRFGAVTGGNPPAIEEYSCEGCGFCARICPVEAISLQPVLAGYRYLSETPYGPLVHARLGTGRENSGKLVAEVRKAARELAEGQGCSCLLTDGPPGTACPAISALAGAGLVLLVTEPTVSGRHDLARAAGLCRHFEVPAVVCLNKFDLSPEAARQVEDFCRAEGLEVVGRVPFDPAVPRALAQGQPPVEAVSGTTAASIQHVWDQVRARLAAPA